MLLHFLDATRRKTRNCLPFDASKSGSDNWDSVQGAMCPHDFGIFGVELDQADENCNPSIEKTMKHPPLKLWKSKKNAR